MTYRASRRAALSLHRSSRAGPYFLALLGACTLAANATPRQDETRPPAGRTTGMRLEARLEQAWRWREILSPPPAEVRHVVAFGPDGIAVSDQSGLRRFDGVTWLQPEGWALARGEEVDAVWNLSAGICVLTRTRVLLLSSEGIVREAARPQGFTGGRPVELPAGGIGLCYDNCVMRFEPGGLEVYAELPDEVGRVTAAATTEAGELFLSSSTGVYRETSEGWRRVPLPEGADARSGFPHIVPVGHELLFFPGNTEPRAFGLRWTGERLVPFELSTRTEVYATARGPGETVLTSERDQRLVVYRNGRGVLSHPQALFGQSVLSATFTRSNRLVVATTSGRLFSCDLESERWQSWAPQSAGESKSVNALFPSRRGGLWLATGAGVFRWEDGEFVESFEELDGKPLEGVTAIAEDEYGSLWIGSGGRFRGAYQYDGQRWIHHDEPEGVGGSFVHAIRIGPTGELWFLLLGDIGDVRDRGDAASRGGVAILNSLGWRRPAWPGGNLEDRVYDVAFQRDGVPLVVTYAGVWRMPGQVLEPIGSGVEAPCFALHIGRDGRLWLGHGLYAAGLQVHDGSERGWSSFVAPELAHVTAADFAESGDGVLWMASGRGVYSWDGTDVVEVTAEEGVPSNHFWPVLADGDGGVWLGSMEAGLVHYRPDDRRRPVVRDVEVTQNPSNRHWVVDWTAVDPWSETPRGQLRYRVRIDGGAWSPTLRETRCWLGRLEEGEHEVEVEAMDLARNRSSAGAAPFTVRSVWSEAWVRASTAAAVLGLAALAWAAHVRRVRRRSGQALLLSRAETSERHYRTLVNRAEVLLACHDRAGQLEFVSPFVEELTGYAPEAFYEDDELLSRTVHPGDRAIAARFGAARRKGARESVQAELRIRHRGGAVHWLQCKQRPRLDAGGALLGFDSVAYEITERKVLEAALRDSELHARRVVETCREGAWLLDAQWRTQLVNRRLARFLGRSPAELGGHALGEFLDADGSAAVRRAMEPSSGQDDTLCRVRVRSAHGEWTWAELEAHWVHAPDGSAVGRLVLVAPISAEGPSLPAPRAAALPAREPRSRALRRVRESAELGVLAACIAHDFDNLLVVVQGQCEAALRDLGATSSAADYLRNLQSASHRGEVCLRLLSQAGNAPARDAHGELGPLLEQVEPLLTAAVSNRTLISVEVEPGLPAVRADPAQLRQLVLCLVLNAADAIGDEVGQVTVRAARYERGELSAASIVVPAAGAGPFVRLEVSDTGRGMDEEVRRQVFGSSATARGLGLAAVQRIVRHLGGALSVSSSPREGSTLILFLPWASGAEPEVRARRVEEDESPARG